MIKKIECSICGKKFHPKGYYKHHAFCTGKNAKPMKRKYTKKKKVKSFPAFSALDAAIVFATLQVEIDMAKGIELGVIKFVAKD